MSEIIRHKLWTSFRSEDRKRILVESTKKVFGLWKDREVDPEIYIRKMRKGDRLGRGGKINLRIDNKNIIFYFFNKILTQEDQ